MFLNILYILVFKARFSNNFIYHEKIIELFAGVLNISLDKRIFTIIFIGNYQIEYRGVSQNLIMAFKKKLVDMLAKCDPIIMGYIRNIQRSKELSVNMLQCL